MKEEKYKKLIDVHLQHRIWRNELELALMEIDFWEDLLEKESVGQTPENLVITSQLHHYQRLAQQLLAELLQQESQVATGVQMNRVLTAPTLADYMYLRERMDAFRVNFQEYKNEVRQYVSAQPSL